MYAVVEGIVTREEILALFGSLFTGNEADPDSGFWSFVADGVCDLYPEELMPVIEKAFADGLIETLFIDRESFERVLRQGKTRTLREIKTDLERYMPSDFHDRMSWWACFRQEPKEKSTPVSTVKSGAGLTNVPTRTLEPPQAARKLGRNDPCWCGSGKKYKRCHLRSDRGQ